MVGSGFDGRGHTLEQPANLSLEIANPFILCLNFCVKKRDFRRKFLPFLFRAFGPFDQLPKSRNASQNSMFLHS